MRWWVTIPFHHLSFSMKRYALLCLVLSLALSSCTDERIVDSPVLVPKTAPAIPALSSPADGAIKQTIPLTLTWTPSAEATSYAIQVSKNKVFTDICYSAGGVGSTSHDVSALMCGRQYWWRVKATSPVGTSEWSGSRSFVTFSLATPGLSSPANSGTNQPLTLTLTWTAAEGAVTYAVQVSTESSFAIPHHIVCNDSGLTGTSHQLAGLSKTSTYYWRVRAKAGIFYSRWSAAWKYQTLAACATPEVEHEGSVYPTVSIKDQCWLKRNLDAGAMIASGISAEGGGVTEKYCYDNDPSNCVTFGGLYSWGEAMRYGADPGAQGICPEGWHIPTHGDINVLSAALGDSSLSRNYVAVPDGGTDATGFSARLAGYFDYGYFGELGDVTKFWMSEKDNSDRAYYWVLGKTGYGLVWVRADKSAGYSIRCVED
jgi:uncharacterized protein (TIGR02145 family)